MPRFEEPVEQGHTLTEPEEDQKPERIPLSPSQRVGLFVRIIATIVLLIAMALLALAWALPFHTDAQASAYDKAAFVSFFVRVYQFEFGVSCGVLAAFLLMMRCWKRSAVALMLCLASVVPDLWMARQKSPPAANGSSLRVMSMSLLSTLRDASSACDAILDQKPDVVSVQELTPRFADEMSLKLAAMYPYSIVQPKELYDGLAVFSKQPITLEASPLDEGKRWFRASMTWNNQQVALYVIHLAPPQTVNGLRANRWQVGELMAEAANEKRPMVLAGDFNFTNMTPQAIAMRSAGFIDAHSVAGHDSGDTWPTAVGASLVPSVRIDTVYTRGPISATASRVAQRFGSDHMPIVVDLSLANLKK